MALHSQLRFSPIPALALVLALALAGGAFPLGAAPAATEPQASALDTYTIDPVHSEMAFRIRHLGVSKVPGRFTSFKGTIQVNPADFTKSSVEVEIDAASINTNNDARDKHLRSDAFFDAAKFPTLTFKSSSVTQPAKDKLEVTGTFTMHGVAKTIVIPISILGFGPGMKPGTAVAGFEGSLTLNRSDYGIKTYIPVVGDEVAITLSVEADKVMPAQPAQ